MIVRGCSGCGARVEIHESLAREAATGPVFCGMSCTGRHSSGCPLRKDGTPYFEEKCCACGAIITWTGATALIMYQEHGTGRLYCDETCERGSGVAFRWQRPVFGKELRAMERTLAKRRQMVAEGRR